MNSLELAQPLNGSDKPYIDDQIAPAGQARSIVHRFVISTLAVIDREFHKLRHDPTDLIARAVQPLLWLLIFGQVFAKLHAIPTGNFSYIEFLAPGILSQSVLFVAIFNGISVISERDMGLVHKFLASPAPRASFVLGKSLAGGVRALTQVVVVVGVSALLGVRLNFSPLHIVGVLLLVILGASVFSTFSLIIACVVKSRERFMGIGQVLAMPLFFASNAIYPISIMPPWLQVVSHINPLTYLVDGLRRLLLEGQDVVWSAILFDFGILSALLVLTVAFCSRLYPNLVR